MVLTYLILIGIDFVILIHLFLLRFRFSWEDRYTCVYTIVYKTLKTAFDHIPNTSNFTKYFPLCV